MNPFLERLGFSSDDRVVICHADDLGVCHAVNQAFAGIVEQGTVCTGSIMVPCAWSPEIFAFAREHADDVDVGIHLTLTSEWETYRWGPISTRDPDSGLMDAHGYFWQDNRPLHAHMKPEAAAAELRAQVERAFAAGVDVTHIDTHMGSVLHLALVPTYIAMAQEYRVPAMLPRLSEEQISARGVPRDMAAQIAQSLRALEETGVLPLLDYLVDLDISPYPDAFDAYRRLIENLKPGLTHLVYHPADANAELKAIMPSPWPKRRAGDYATFASDRLSEVFEASGVKTLTYRALRDLMRAA